MKKEEYQTGTKFSWENLKKPRIDKWAEYEQRQKMIEAIERMAESIEHLSREIHCKTFY